jgi:hypothetical protein
MERNPQQRSKDDQRDRAQAFVEFNHRFWRTGQRETRASNATLMHNSPIGKWSDWINRMHGDALERDSQSLS